MDLESHASFSSGQESNRRSWGKVCGSHSTTFKIDIKRRKCGLCIFHFSLSARFFSIFESNENTIRIYSIQSIDCHVSSLPLFESKVLDRKFFMLINKVNWFCWMLGAFILHIWSNEVENYCSKMCCIYSKIPGMLRSPNSPANERQLSKK